ncbi:type 11 methyltransferase [Candidatus Magnetobacterium bavaricum]|uniref:Type 11 methyltransferase n=1 Tax=Candidatus Magnetobacterium bavaricum TaxID=29290 RepID=A0A0F3GS02_9BACT|nr:type 11 methyltransferase [Candidatus Magnetobacterium bavaricum]
MSGVTSFYDGWFYSKIIDPATAEIRRAIGSLIKDNSSVIDIGCGTGRFALEISRRCRYVVGVDISPRMLKFANAQKQRQVASNVEFIHGDAVNALGLEREFDYAVMSFMLHSVTLREEIKIIENLKGITKNLIFSDYAVPQPKNIGGVITFLAELAAGGRHFRAYREFMSNNGLESLTEKCNLSIREQITDKAGTYKVIMAERQ